MRRRPSSTSQYEALGSTRRSSVYQRCMRTVRALLKYHHGGSAIDFQSRLLFTSKSTMAPPTWNSSPFDTCGGQFAASLVCPRGMFCLPLTSDYSATLCCPFGQDCGSIATISCDIQLWNTTTTPESQVHSSRPVTLASCGDECCPMSYTCNKGQCQRGSLEGAAAESNGQRQSPTAAGETTQQADATSTRTTRPTATSPPTVTAIPRTQTHSSEGGLNMTTKALISVLAALLLIIVIAVFWRCIRRRQCKRVGDQLLEHPECRSYYAPSKAELDGLDGKPWTTIVELNGRRTPGELSAPGSIYHGRYGPRYPKELPAAYFQKAVSINSERRELDAWSLHGWRSQKDEWD